MDWSLVVSIVALVLSAGTVAWQLVRDHWERPVVVVSGIQGSHSSTGKDPHWQYRIDVTNVGERAVTIIQVGLISPRNEEENSFMTVELLQEEVETFPIRLEPHDSRSWTIDAGAYSPNRPEYEPFARLVQRPTWRERRQGILPERTIFGDWFGSYGPERSGVTRRPTKVRKPKRRKPGPPKRLGQRLL